MRLIKNIDEVGFIDRSDGKITYRLDLAPLEELEPIKEKLARLKKEQNEKERQKKAAQRAAKREPDYSNMNALEIVQHGIKSFGKAVGTP